MSTRTSEPIVVDSSACSRALEAMLEPYPEQPEIVDVVDFVATTLLPQLEITNPVGSLLLYPSCANHHLGNTEHLLTIANAVADEVFIPMAWSCCGAHGEQGLLHPELPASATRLVADEISKRTFDAYASTTRTCEVAMSRVTGQPFTHILEVIAKATR